MMGEALDAACALAARWSAPVAGGSRSEVQPQVLDLVASEACDQADGRPLSCGPCVAGDRAADLRDAGRVPFRSCGRENYLVGTEHVGELDPFRGCASYLLRAPAESVVALGLGDDDLVSGGGYEVGLGRRDADGVSQFQFGHVIIAA